MMRLTKYIIIKLIVLSVLIHVSNKVEATPLTFDFTMPNWTNTWGSTAQFGTNATIGVTLDNGSSSNINQTYLATEILSITLATDGSFQHTYDTLAVNEMIRPIITTDNAGTAHLDLTWNIQNERMWFEDPLTANAVLQFGTNQNGPGNTNFVIWDGSNGASWTTAGGAIISSNVQQPVPEPATVALMGIGIVGLVGAGYRKKRKRKQAEKC